VTYDVICGFTAPNSDGSNRRQGPIVRLGRDGGGTEVRRVEVMEGARREKTTKL